MIKFNNSDIIDWNFDDNDIIKVYHNGAIVFYKFDSEQGGYKVCYAVVEDITQYSETEFEDVFDKATEKWYKLNNLNQYEQYGIYGSGRNITYYDGKLTIDDGYEYQYSGGSWVNVGEVSGSTATLPNVPFVLNYNAARYDATTHSIPMTTGQLNDTDAVAYNNPNNIVDHSADGYITISNSSMRIRKQGQDISLFNRTSNSASSDLTIVCKAKSTSGENIITNRDGSYNWMYRLKTSGILRFHGTSETGSISWNTSNPDIMSVRTYYSSGTKVKYNNWTQNTSTTPTSFTYGSTNTDSSSAGALFVGYGWSQTNEQWSGDFYWVYMAQANLTDSQIQEVIDYNEDGGGQSIYPKYYDEIADPLDNLTFNTMEDAQAYAEANCVYDGMKATIDGDRYYFDSSDENGWVKILEYYKFEDVTPGGASGWTISGSSTYNPDSSYYDDFDLETTSTSNVTKIAKVTIYGYENFTYYLRSYGYSNYAYVTSSNVDELTSDPTSMSYSSSSAITNTYGFNKAAGSAVNLNNYRRITYNNLDKTVEHTFYVVFYNGYYTSSSQPSATLLIPKEQDNENWEQVTFSASSNVASSSKSLYIDGNNLTSGGTQSWYYRWIVGLPSGSHSSYTNYSSYDYCPNATSSTFTSVAGEQRQVNFTYDNTTNKTLSFRLTDGNNVLTPSNTVYYNMTYYNSCGASSPTSNVTFPRSQSVKVGGRFRFANSSNRHYIYGYSPNISLNTDYYVNNYQSTFDITYTKLSDEAVTITYTTYDPSDTEVPAFKTDITYPYNGGTTSSTTLTSYAVPYTYSYTVKQTNNMFSASTASYTYTAGQASRTITFTLYPNNREFATVADMEAYTYAWEGMVAYVGTDKYVYQNGSWVYNPSRLPAGYTEVEYIQNTGTSYLDTAIKVKGTYKIEAEMQEVTETNYGRMFGCGTWNRRNGLQFAYQDSSGVKCIHMHFFGTSGWNNNRSFAFDYLKHTYTYNDGVFSIDSSQAGASTSSTGYTAQDNLGVFTYINNGRPSDSGYWGQEHMKGKMYSFKIWDENDTLVRDLVPCIRDNDNTVGAYDLVNDVFYTVPIGYTTDKLVAGNPV